MKGVKPMKTVTANLRHTAFEKIRCKERANFVYRKQRFRVIRVLDGKAFKIYQFDDDKRVWVAIGAPVAFSCFDVQSETGD